MEERYAELLPVPYFQVVFTLPSAMGDIAYTNKAVIYDLLFKASSETLLTIAADDQNAFATFLAPLERTRWFVYARDLSPGRRPCWRTCRATLPRLCHRRGGEWDHSITSAARMSRILAARRGRCRPAREPARISERCVEVWPKLFLFPSV
jgi:hypothetical protein